MHRGNIAIHGIERFEYDQLRPFAAGLLEQVFEMLDVVVVPDQLVATGVTHAFDHRIMIERIAEDQAIGNELGDGRDAGLVGHVAGCEHKRGILAVQIGQLPLELDERMIGTGNVAGTAGTGAKARRCRDHGADDFGVLPHAEIIVRAPDHDIARPGG